MPEESSKEKQEKLAPVSQPKIKKSKIVPEFTENALKVIEKRYLLKDHDGKAIETPAGMFRRIARHMAKVDSHYGAKPSAVAQTEEDFYEAMARLEFVPNSPTFWGAGTTLGQLSACFVLPVEDNMASILKTQMNMGLIHKSGGGTGFSFSRLRPADSIVGTTGGIASGPIGFMQMYNDTSGIIKEGGRRRGANMGILRVDHPDILNFISYKNQEGALSNFNISVAVSDNFMKAVEEDTTYDLINPQTGQKTGELNAREVFDKIVRGAWQNGEPGVVFLDAINRHNPTPLLGEIESTNPCVVGETFIPTRNGLEKIENVWQRFLKGGTPTAVLTDGRVSSSNKTILRPITKIFNLGKKEIIQIMTKSGYELKGTYDHKIFTPTGWVALKDIKKGNIVFLQKDEGQFGQNDNLPLPIKQFNQGRKPLNLPYQWSKELGQILGLLVGDGWLRAGDKNCRVGFTFSKDDEEILNYSQSILNRWYNAPIKPVQRENGVWHLSYHAKNFVKFFQSLGVKTNRADRKEVPETIFTAPKKTVIGFLQGIFTADGTVNFRKNHSSYVRLTSKSFKLLKQTQLILLNLAIKSRIYNRSRQSRQMFPYTTVRGEKKSYQVSGELYELEISRQSVLRFLKVVGFLKNKHSLKVQKFPEKKYYQDNFEEEIIFKKRLGETTVYDVTEPETLTFITNGFISLDCGEQPLLPYESCNLGSINLGLMIKIDAQGKIEIDWDKLDRTVALAVHFLDNVIDANKFPIPEIEEMTKRTRKIGLGVMGLADLFFQLGIPYDSEKGLEISEKIMKRVTEKSHEVSAEIAKSRGNFPAFKESVWDKKGVKHQRNATTTTIAPTGTISMIASASSGIEPIFALVYTKTVMDGTALVNVNEYFKEALKKAGIYTDELIKKVAENNGSIQNIEEIPKNLRRVFATAGDISPEWHVKIQAAFQKYTDNAISKTINFPNSATIEDVEKSYLLAYKLGCKGITVYRDGSRVEQVLTTGVKEGEKKAPTPDESESRQNVGKEPIIQSQAVVATGVRIIPRERPDVIRGYTYRIKTAYGKLFVTINDDEEGQPFEVFSHLGKAGGFFMAKAEAITRMISLALRSGIDPQEIIDQLKGIRGPTPTWSEEGKMILSLPDAIAQILEKHIHREQPNLDLAFKMPDITPVSEEKIAESVQMSDGFSTVQKERSLADIGEAPACPECGGMLEFSEGCLKCMGCGYSKCS